MTACAEPEPIRLLAVRGCGLDQEFSGLRIRVLGDFSAGAGQELVLGPDESGTLATLADDATGVAAEGLFGTTVTAVGRSYGVDPNLARGRLADGPALAIYFAAPDRACAVPGSPSGRSDLAGAEGLRGELLLVGGRDGAGAALDELVVVDLLTDEAWGLEARLPAAIVGHGVLAIGPRRFAIVSGARDGAVFSEWIPVLLSGADPPTATIEAPRSLVEDGQAVATAFFASATSPVDGATLIAGGCTSVTADDRCVAASAIERVRWARAVGAPLELELEPGPPLQRRRFAAAATIGDDGVAYVAGGFDELGQPVAEIERLRPGGAWQVIHALAGGETIADLAVLDGELLVLATVEGPLYWWSPAGDGLLDPSARAPSLAAAPRGRRLLALPGERLVVDRWLFAPGSAAIDPAGERIAFASEADDRSGAAGFVLADGSALLAGGAVFTEGLDAVVEPSLLRLRPALDGPDEWIPDLAGPDTDAFVSNAPGQATVVVGGLLLAGVDQDLAALPRVRAHVRGFRSHAARLEFAVTSDGTARPWLLLTQGSAAVGVALRGQASVRVREADGSERALDCALATPGVEDTIVLELGEDGRQLHLSARAGEGEAATILADCSLDPGFWPRADRGPALGFGAGGVGEVAVFALRLARR